jgi:hypothetical protein
MTELNSEQQQAILFQLEIELMKREFFEFVTRAVAVLEPSTEFEFPPHVEYICKTLQDEAKRIHNKELKNKDILINQPPRTMKSLIISVLFNAWVWTWFPEARFLTISYSDTLASQFSYQTRLLIKSDWYRRCFPEVQIQDDDNRKTQYSNSAGGMRIARGAAAQITGSGSDFILVDDLQKPSDISQTKLDNAILQYRDVIYNRLNQPKYGIRVICSQRVADTDISNWVLTHDPELYHHICLPMELSDDVKPMECRSFYDGETGLLWKSRFDNKTLLPYRKNKFFWSAQYLQNPVPMEGTLIMRKWLRILEFSKLSAEQKQEILNLKYDAWIDSAYTQDPDRDETAVIVAARWGQYLLIKKCYELHLEFPELLTELERIYNEDLGRKGMLRIEAKANGLSILQTFKRKGINITKTENPTKDKIYRVTEVLDEIESERVWLLDTGNPEYLINQAIGFPNGIRDGLVDVLVYGIKDTLHRRGMRTKMIGR